MADTNPRAQASRTQTLTGSLAALLIVVGFFVVVALDLAWIVALDAKEAALRYQTPTPPGATAVIWSHGHYSVWPLGTVRQNPWGFVLFNAAVAAVIWALRYKAKPRD